MLGVRDQHDPGQRPPPVDQPGHGLPDRADLVPAVDLLTRQDDTSGLVQHLHDLVLGETARLEAATRGPHRLAVRADHPLDPLSFPDLRHRRFGPPAQRLVQRDRVCRVQDPPERSGRRCRAHQPERSRQVSIEVGGDLGDLVEPDRAARHGQLRQPEHDHQREPHTARITRVRDRRERVQQSVNLPPQHHLRHRGLVKQGKNRRDYRHGRGTSASTDGRRRNLHPCRSQGRARPHTRSARPTRLTQRRATRADDQL